MNNIKAIIFDYDGVIAESVNVKTEAFAELYLPFGEDVVNKVVTHHEAHGGMSRFEKFKLYHNNFLRMDIDESQVQELAKQFSELVLQKVIEAPYVNGAFAFISANYQKYDFFISTGTPTDEIEIILQRKSLREFFKAVYGSPEKKDIHVIEILEKYNYKKNEVVFVGDAVTDRDAARNNNIAFIGRFTTDKIIKKEPYLFDNFTEFQDLIGKQ